MYMYAQRQGSNASALATEGIGLRGGVGIASILLLLFAFVSPADLRVLLASGGLLGLLGVRLAAADAGWARRGSAWTEQRGRQPVE